MNEERGRENETVSMQLEDEKREEKVEKKRQYLLEQAKKAEREKEEALENGDMNEDAEKAQIQSTGASSIYSSVN